MNNPCCPPRTLYRATKTYVAKCMAGMVGEPVSITRSYQSYVSQEHADQTAMALAKTEAELELQCVFTSTQGAQVPCLPESSIISRTATSTVSQAAANDNAILAATQAAAAMCE